MNTGIKVGQSWGIPIRLHLSWFLIFGLVTWSLATGYFPEEYPTLPPLGLWLLGGVTSLLFFGSVLAHELGHVYMALRNGIPVQGITLFIFGGVAQLSREPRSAGAEFRIAIAGPLVSLALAVVFDGLWVLDQTIPFLAALSIWLARINLMLALFNLIPGFPLDGGRVLRALIWRITGSPHRATKAAAITGQVVAFGFIGWGVFTLINGAFFNGLWLAFIGWFLQNAAAASLAQSTLEQSLRGVKVAQVMSRDTVRVPAGMSLARLVEENILTGGQRTFFVTENGLSSAKGMLTLRDLSAVPQPNWGQVTAGQAMVPWERLVKVEPDAELFAALQRMDEANVAQLPVVEGQTVQGVLSREHVLHYIRLRTEIGV